MDDFATGYLAGQDGGNNNGGFFGNEGLWAVIILAIIFGWGTNGYGRNGSTTEETATPPIWWAPVQPVRAAQILVQLCLRASTSRTLPVLWLASRVASALLAMTSSHR